MIYTINKIGSRYLIDRVDNNRVWHFHDGHFPFSTKPTKDFLDNLDEDLWNEL